jgi:chemotaxis protein CheZ
MPSNGPEFDRLCLALRQRFSEIGTRYPHVAPEMVAEVVEAVLSIMGGVISAHDAVLLTELKDLGSTIAKAKAEIAALRVEEIAASHIPAATDELDAIVQHTAAATEAILESCEKLDGLADKLASKYATVLQSATTRIFEACSFQDITGQRISKVVATLKTIEARIAHIVATVGMANMTPEAPAVSGQQVANSSGPSLPSLENGPPLPGAAMDQSDIDRLLASIESGSD